jgi:ATP-dependent helicase/nuclease subunit A
VSVPGLADAGARSRIETDLGSNLCVEAGAGTGKTTVLVGRVVALLRSGQAAVDELAVITFTEKAAGELSARVRFALERALEQPGLGDEERTRVARALTDLYRARIQTIHAFASDLLRERPVEARLDPQFETMDEVAAEVRFEQAYRRWLDGQLAGRNPPIERALRRGLHLGRLRDLLEMVHRNRRALPLAPMTVPTPRVEPFRARAREWEDRLAALEPRCREPDSDAAYGSLAAIRAFCSKVAIAHGDEDVERLVLFERPEAHRTAGRAGAWENGACADVKRVAVECLDAVQELSDQLRAEALAGVLPLAAAFAEQYARERRTEGLADFDDLLIWARDLLRDDPRARAHFHRRTTRVLVDEFQDTDPVQAELVAWLCAPEGTTGPWREIVPEPGSLFVVGDPKQSIYRFRGADIAVYDAVKGGTLAGRLELLTHNFRSSIELLDWLNAVFDRVLVEKAGVQAPNSPLAGLESMTGELGRSPVVVLRPEPSDGNADAVREREAGLLARAISRAVRDEGWRVRDRHQDGRVRPARWADVAILVPSRTGIERLEGALARYGVPYRLEGGRGFFVRQEVRDLASLLHAIDDPTDAIALVATLRSLAFGCSDEDLLAWVLEHSRFDYRRVDADTPGPPAVREAMAMLRELHYAAGGLSLAELVRAAIERTGLVEGALGLPGGSQAAANAIKLLDHAREFSAAGSGALRAFTGWLARMRDREAEEIDAPVAEERDDTVRVMTVHAAKGLEFPIVCLGNLSATGSNQTAPVADPERGRIDLKIGPDGKDYRTPGWEDVRAQERAALEAERDRLLYVACTRARDHLVVPVSEGKRGPQGFLKQLVDSLPQADGEPGAGGWLYDLERLEAVAEVPPVQTAAAADTDVEAALERRSQWSHERERVVAEASRGVALTTASSVKVDPRPLAAQVVSVPAEGEQVTTIDVDSTPPLELGDAFHRVMERVSLPDADDLEALAQAICAEAGIPEAVPRVLAMARRCLASDEIERALATGDVHREVPFVTGDDVDGVLVGRMDLLYRDGQGGAVVIDYKTDTVDPGGETAAAADHGGQTEAYARAVRDTLGLQARVLLLFAVTGVAVEVG